MPYMPAYFTNIFHIERKQCHLSSASMVFQQNIGSKFLPKINSIKPKTMTFVRCSIGWTVFQKRINGSENFYRDWSDYKRGFGDIAKEFWLGNDILNRITASQAYVLRVDMEDFDGARKYAAYDAFNISSEAQKYKLHLGTYSGKFNSALKIEKS